MEYITENYYTLPDCDMEQPSYLSATHNNNEYTEIEEIKTHPVIKNAFIEMHHDNIYPLPITVFDTVAIDDVVTTNDIFGVLTIKLNTTTITQQPIFILLTIDKTGSMDDNSIANSQGEHISKLEYLIRTCKNMIEYLSRQPIVVFLTVHTFNTILDVIISNIQVNNENKEFIINKFEGIIPTGATNIGLALLKSQSTLKEYRAQNPTHKISHIFMTDGDPTTGITTHELLCDIIDDSFNNIFIGFGTKHNASLLRLFSEKKNTEYHVVDNIENTGVVYCDSIYQLLYPAIENITIEIINGLVYNWKTNEWCSALYENVFISDVEKTYHVRSKYPDLIKANISGIVSAEMGCVELLDQVLPLPDLHDEYGNITCCTDLTRYVFRQKVQEVLFNLLSLSLKNSNFQGIRRRYEDADTVEHKQHIRLLFSKIRKYMRQNELLGDPFMLLLCEDLLVVYKNIGYKNSLMYVSARQTSQGTQQSYTVNNVNYEYEYENEYENENDNDNKTTVSNFALPPSLLRSMTIDVYSQQEEDMTINYMHDDINDIHMDSDDDTEEDLDDCEDEDTINIEDDIDNINNVLYNNNNASPTTTTCYATDKLAETMRLFY